MITTIIIGKRSYISSNLKKNFSNSHVFSTKEISRVNKLINKEKTINIIYNHSFPISKLNTTEDYSAIIDKNARIGANCVISPEGKPGHYDGDNYYVREGIAVVPKGAVIPDDTII